MDSTVIAENPLLDYQNCFEDKGNPAPKQNDGTVSLTTFRSWLSKCKNVYIRVNLNDELEAYVRAVKGSAGVAGMVKGMDRNTRIRAMFVGGDIFID